MQPPDNERIDELINDAHRWLDELPRRMKRASLRLPAKRRGFRHGEDHGANKW